MKGPGRLGPWGAPVAVLTLIAGLAGPALGQADGSAAEYAACLRLAERSPAEAALAAASWQAAGGGNAARHCAAVARLNGGQPGRAARDLRDLGGEVGERDPELAARLLDEAGRAFLIAGEPGEALDVLGRAASLAPDDPDVHLAHAFAAAALQDYWTAVDDLSRALDLGADPAETWMLRAAAHRFLGNLELALDDAERAVAADPASPDAFLERGNVHRLMGRDEEAQADWERVIDLAPAGPAADAARVNLERLGG